MGVEGINFLTQEFRALQPKGANTDLAPIDVFTGHLQNIIDPVHAPAAIGDQGEAIRPRFYGPWCDTNEIKGFILK